MQKESGRKPQRIEHVPDNAELVKIIRDTTRKLEERALAHVTLMRRIGQYERDYGVLIVSANNKAGHVELKPLLQCPEMIYEKACKVCIWNDRKNKECRGG